MSPEQEALARKYVENEADVSTATSLLRETLDELLAERQNYNGAMIDHKEIKNIIGAAPDAHPVLAVRDYARNMKRIQSRDFELLDLARARAERAEGNQRWIMGFSWVAIALTVVAVGTLGVRWHQFDPIVCPPPPEPVVCPPEVVCDSDDTPIQSDTEAGYWRETEMGGRQLQPWPDATNYPAHRFEDDCRDVCAVPEGFSGDRRPGRVLVVDPPHLVCVCLHPDSHGSAWSVARWIGWERVR